ncbi:keratin, type I cytoskeletal 19-like [Ambystoma mexicanum]|uniref:keratin, type I cytoskeletal 19-like n=1 Tax=Ambystoma mexicanum TaxID=8296 RepID=UPI0037E95D61
MANRVVVQRSSSSSSTRLPSAGYRVAAVSQMAPSVYGGAGGYGTRVSTSSVPVNYSYMQLGSKDNILLSGGEKVTMQNLNDRLAAYLDKVRSLESANSQLEIKIKEHSGKVSPTTGRDFSKYYQTIQDLQAQIFDARQNNVRLLLHVDNARLAADDFKTKYETEVPLRNSVVVDIGGLRRLLDDLTMKRSDLEMEIEHLQEELSYLKKNHATEVEELSQHLGGSVSVEVDAAPSVDLGKVMAEMRAQYDNLAAKNRVEAKERFEKESQQLIKQVNTSSEELTSRKSEVTDVRRRAQSLEIELQSLLNMKAALEGTVADTEARYGAQIEQVQAQIRILEANLGQIRGDMEQQRNDYSLLLNIKLRLEMEIAEYRRLLGGDEENMELEKNLLEEAKKGEANL